MFEDICKIYKNFMNKDFASFELAVKLKEKGFDEPCYGYYHCNGGNDSFELCGNGDRDFLNSKNKHRIAAPTISQVLKWLREEHHLHFEVVGAAYGYNLIISDTPDKGGTDRYYSHANDDGPNDGGAWDRYEDCVLYGIKYVLDNLI